MKTYLASPKKQKKLRLLAFDALLVLLAILFSYVIRIIFYEGSDITELPQRISWLIIPAVVVHLISFYVFGLYEEEVYVKRKHLFINILLSVLVAGLGVAILSFIFPAYQIGRIMVGIHIFLMVAVIYAWRIFYVFGKRKEDKKRTIILGWDGVCQKIMELLGKDAAGYGITGIVIGDRELIPAGLGNPVPVYTDIETALQNCRPEVIILSNTIKYVGLMRDLLLDLKFKGTEIYSSSKFYERISGRLPIDRIPESWLLLTGSGSAFQPVIYQQVKRLIDIAVSVLALLVSAPVCLLVALLIKLDSRGPVLFRQERVGQYEKPFMLLKFRTMVEDAEKDCGPRWACEDDPRITRVGKILRKTHLDEFPQFLNVLKGDMSLVGPRPFRKVFTDMLAEKFPFYRLRFKVKPGVSGWAQVNMDKGNTDQGQYEKLEYEIYYIYHQSIFLDLFILLKTLQAVIKMKGG
jgi:exopolysaccharide biosynthesis polyprenyl glycosylphosphotransferase